LKKLRRKGADGFYTGPIAEQIVEAVQGDSPAGDMTLEDLANYNIVVRDPVCLDYRGHNVCGMGPPSSGAIAVGQILGILENFDLVGDPLDIENVHLFTQAGRLAFADRGLYVADSDFVDVPVAGLLDKAYLKTRADLINLGSDLGSADPGVPPGVVVAASPDNVAKNSGTSHVSIVDRYGNALSMTTTIESSFGNGVMVNGFLLNNELTDFAFTPVSNELPVANRVQGNKRPRSSMSPTIVFDDKGRVEYVTGSPGGSRIIGYTAQSIMNMIDFGLDPQEAINVPHYMNRNGRTDVESPIEGVTQNYDAENLAARLKMLGHSDPQADLADRQVGVIAQTSGLSIIQILRKEKVKSSKRYGDFRHFFKYWGKHRRTMLVGGSDKRRDGTVDGR
jgi:gamma-glutamyltranspeptidase/glutathione hydrolase